MTNSVILEGIVEGFELVNGTFDFELSFERKYRNYQGKEVTEKGNFDCICFGEMAKKCNENFKVGMEVRVIGRLHQTKWESGGQKHSAVEVICEHIESK